MLITEGMSAPRCWHPSQIPTSQIRLDRVAKVAYFEQQTIHEGCLYIRQLKAAVDRSLLRGVQHSSHLALHARFVRREKQAKRDLRKSALQGLLTQYQLRHTGCTSPGHGDLTL